VYLSSLKTGATFGLFAVSGEFRWIVDLDAPHTFNDLDDDAINEISDVARRLTGDRGLVKMGNLKVRTVKDPDGRVATGRLVRRSEEEADSPDDADPDEDVDESIELDDLARFVVEALDYDELQLRCGLVDASTRAWADVAVKRAIVEAYVEALDRYHRPTGRQYAAGELIGLATAVRAIAAAYPERTGWQRDWRIT
jgi:hypothetical protein